MKKEIVSGLAIVTLSALPAQSQNFGTGNVYDRYWAGENISLPEVQGESKDRKLLPDKPILQPIQVPDQQLMLKYGVPYPIMVKPVAPIVETKYGIPYPMEVIEPIKIPHPVMKYGMNIPR